MTTIKSTTNCPTCLSECNVEGDLTKNYVPKYTNETHPFSEDDVLQIIQGLKNYTHESHTILGHDEREPIEFLELWKSQRNKLI